MADLLKMYEAYHKHLDYIRELKISVREDDYICPICLCGYSMSEMDQLSLEDAPQAALGGRKVAITCKKCNNTCGNTIDCHFVNYIDTIERKNLLPGSNQKIRIINLGEGKPIEAALRVDEEKEMYLSISKDYYNSLIFNERLNKLIKDREIIVQEKNKEIDFNLVSAAIIKNAYIILFSKFGYSFILDDYYDKLRNQIQVSNSNTSQAGLWTILPSLPISDGIYRSYDSRYRGFFVAYTVSRILSYRIIVYIPTPLVNFDIATTVIRDVSNLGGLCLIRFDESNLLYDKNKISSLRNWVYTNN